jgi:hypothetical protein
MKKLYKLLFIYIILIIYITLEDFLKQYYVFNNLKCTSLS